MQAVPPATPESLAARAEELYRDLRLESVRAWKAANPGAPAIGHMPVYVPREIVHAAGALPVGIMGGGDQVEIIRGDAYFQSYICQIPRSTLELALSGQLDALDGMIFPSICDVIRNLSGMWKLLFPEKLAFYLDLPQNFRPDVGADYYERELRRLAGAIGCLAGVEVTPARLRASIELYDGNRSALAALEELRWRAPWKAPAHEVYLLSRAGQVLPVEAHTRMLLEYVRAAAASDRPRRDLSRVVLTGAFCEQPPLELIRTLERAGCYLVADDLVLGPRSLRGPVPVGSDPFRALARAYTDQGVAMASRYEPGPGKGDDLVRLVRERSADGVLFCAASFCDPALLEQPMLASALDAAGIPHTAFKFAENLGQFQVIREQAGTFADTIRLWGGENAPAAKTGPV